MSWNIPLFIFLLSSARLLAALRIEVFNRSDNNEVGNFVDAQASVDGKSVGFGEIPVLGLLIYPSPRNACSEVEPPPAPYGENFTWIAYIPDYSACPAYNAYYLAKAGYEFALAYASDPDQTVVHPYIPQAIVPPNAVRYLEEHVVIANYSRNETYNLYVKVSEDYFLFYKRLMLLFGIVMIAAIVFSIGIFCSVAFCRYMCIKWRTRGLTRWRVHQLPKRRFRLSRDGSQTCSICLEDFKDKEYMRVLPCDHVFHPSCVDEWLQKWNRTCPLCKTTISRRRLEDEQTRLLTAESEPSSDPPSERGSREGYGAVGDAPRDEEGSSPVIAVAVVHPTDTETDPPRSSSATAAAV